MLSLFAGFVCETSYYPQILLSRMIFWSSVVGAGILIFVSFKKIKTWWLKIISTAGILLALVTVLFITTVFVIPWGCSVNPLDFSKPINPNYDPRNYGPPTTEEVQRDASPQPPNGVEIYNVNPQ